MFRFIGRFFHAAAALKKKIKPSIQELKITQFRLHSTYPNITTLLSVKKGDVLTANPHGRLQKLSCKSQKKKYIVKNALLWGKPKERVAKAIEYTLMSFCHEAKNPVILPRLRLVKGKTVKRAEEVMHKLDLLDLEPQFIGRMRELIRQYLMSSIVQERMLQKLSKSVRHSKRTSRLLRNADLNNALTKQPIIPKMGCSGSYLIRGSNRLIAGVFKPYDEEIEGPNNPVSYNLRGIIGQRNHGFGTCVGEGVHREVAAYVVDKFLQIGLVPETCYGEFSHSLFYNSAKGKYLPEVKNKVGSFQEYMSGFKHVYEMTAREVEQIPVDQIHRLIILDLIIGNMDRNISNILTDGRRLVAIDHGLSLPSRHFLGRIQNWTHLPQMSVVFFPSLADKVQQLPVEHLCAKLKKQCWIDECCLQRLRERVALLQEAARKGMTPKQIVGLMSETHLNQLKDLALTLRAAAAQIVDRQLALHLEKKNSHAH